MTLVGFLTARLDEDEAAARPTALVQRFAPTVAGDIESRASRALAEVAAKRAIVEQAQLYGCLTTMTRLLSAIYADHPDYDEAWRP
jgi:hypothetical protein